MCVLSSKFFVLRVSARTSLVGILKAVSHYPFGWRRTAGVHQSYVKRIFQHFCIITQSKDVMATDIVILIEKYWMFWWRFDDFCLDRCENQSSQHVLCRVNIEKRKGFCHRRFGTLENNLIRMEINEIFDNNLVVPVSMDLCDLLF